MRYTQFFEHIFLEVSVPFDFIPEFPEFSVEWFTFRKFVKFGIFVPFVPVSKSSEILVQWKAPQVHTCTQRSTADNRNLISKRNEALHLTQVVGYPYTVKTFMSLPYLSLHSFAFHWFPQNVRCKAFLQFLSSQTNLAVNESTYSYLQFDRKLNISNKFGQKYDK